MVIDNDDNREIVEWKMAARVRAPEEDGTMLLPLIELRSAFLR